MSDLSCTPNSRTIEGRQIALCDRLRTLGCTQELNPFWSPNVSRGACILVHGDLLRQHSFATTLRFTDPVLVDCQQ